MQISVPLSPRLSDSESLGVRHNILQFEHTPQWRRTGGGHFQIEILHFFGLQCLQ